jgi:hypothetical protein
MWFFTVAQRLVLSWFEAASLQVTRTTTFNAHCQQLSGVAKQLTKG